MRAFLCNFGIHGWSSWREEQHSRWTIDGPRLASEMENLPVIVRRSCGLCGEIERKEVPVAKN